jgi:hypothetical protein
VRYSVNTHDNWRKSSYSDGGDGNDCVEIAALHAHIAIRDSKDPTHGTLPLSTGAFTTFVESLKRGPYAAVTDVAVLRG